FEPATLRVKVLTDWILSLALTLFTAQAASRDAKQGRYYKMRVSNNVSIQYCVMRGLFPHTWGPEFNSWRLLPSPVK
ncbi:MAG: hypothetical protein J1F02_06085, partial [Lachnospiraceae bacterium]|nr:hypothetical protein [Lachnospiraceae bacterium]